jgi:hypothetical protein
VKSEAKLTQYVTPYSEIPPNTATLFKTEPLDTALARLQQYDDLSEEICPSWTESPVKHDDHVEDAPMGHIEPTAERPHGAWLQKISETGSPERLEELVKEYQKLLGVVKLHLQKSMSRIPILTSKFPTACETHSPFNPPVSHFNY